MACGAVKKDERTVEAVSVLPNSPFISFQDFKRAWLERYLPKTSFEYVASNIRSQLPKSEKKEEKKRKQPQQ